MKGWRRKRRRKKKFNRGLTERGKTTTITSTTSRLYAY